MQGVVTIFHQFGTKMFLSPILGWPVWFRMQDQNSPAVTLLTEEDKSLGKKKIQVTDLVLGVRTTMPCLKEEWVKEKRNTIKWLTQAQLEKLRYTRCDYTAFLQWQLLALHCVAFLHCQFQFILSTQSIKLNSRYPFQYGIVLSIRLPVNQPTCLC